MNFTVLPITRIRPAGEVRLRTDRHGVPGMAARAAVAADYHRVASDHLFDTDLMVCTALGAEMGDARRFRLSEGQRSLGVFDGHFSPFIVTSKDRNGNSRLAVFFQIGVSVETILVELEQPP